MPVKMPEIKHVYKNHHIDSAVWAHYFPRKDDIIISSGFKSGTTWMQTIIAHLIFENEAGIPWPIQTASPWVESTWRPLKTLEHINRQKHRRFLKTHLPLDGIPYYPFVKYIVLARDIRDIGISLWNHYSNYTEFIYRRFNTLPRSPENIHCFLETWLSRGWFSWEHEGFPFWGVMHHLMTWWEHRDMPNMFFIRFEDLLEDPAGRICEVADFLGVSLTKKRLKFIVSQTRFETMRENSEKIWQNPHKIWKNGGDTFFFKGKFGNWKSVFSPVELEQYKKTSIRVLQPDCKLWIEK